jgi:hypothetical protein
MAFRITKEWLINIPDEFEHRVEDEKLVFWKTGITVIAVPFRLPGNSSKLDLLFQIQEKKPENILETFVSTKGEIAGLGYTQLEEVDGDKKRLSLTTFTVSDTTCLQVAFYLDDPTDLDWAKSTWKGIVFHPEADQTDVFKSN